MRLCRVEREDLRVGEVPQALHVIATVQPSCLWFFPIERNAGDFAQSEETQRGNVTINISPLTASARSAAASCRQLISADFERGALLIFLFAAVEHTDLALISTVFEAVGWQGYPE